MNAVGSVRTLPLIRSISLEPAAWLMIDSCSVNPNGFLPDTDESAPRARTSNQVWVHSAPMQCMWHAVQCWQNERPWMDDGHGVISCPVPSRAQTTLPCHLLSLNHKSNSLPSSTDEQYNTKSTLSESSWNIIFVVDIVTYFLHTWLLRYFSSESINPRCMFASRGSYMSSCAFLDRVVLLIVTWFLIDLKSCNFGSAICIFRSDWDVDGPFLR
jgi:hypothetical protein